MQSEALPLYTSIVPFFLSAILTGLILIVPIWKIYKKTGSKRPAWSLLIFFPFPVGIWIVCTILAFSHWPATDSTDSSEK